MLVIIRGNSCSGKSTIAENLRKLFNNSNVAVIHTETFYWQIVRGDKPSIVMENVRRIIDNYLKEGYDVILEGTLSNKMKSGKLYVSSIERLARKYNIPLRTFFLKANFNELLNLEKVRKKISLKRLKELYSKTSKTERNNEIVIDTSGKSPRKVLFELRKNLEIYS